MAKCSVENCESNILAKQLCSKHYQQKYIYGGIRRTKFDPNEILEYDSHAEIKLYDAKGNHIASTLIDLDDSQRARKYKWYLSGGYVKTQDGLTLADYIMRKPREMYIDHANRNTLDNRKSNLRICTAGQNNCNKPNCGNRQSKYKGVHYNGYSWCAFIYKGKSYYIGSYNSEIEAARAYDIKAIELHGEFAYLNFPEDYDGKD